MPGWIIIPDIHGRSFWKDSVRGHEDENIVFLGDYLDPYPAEGIMPDQASNGLEEIIAFKKDHPGNVVLLLGNHDLGYIDADVCHCRHDYGNEDRNRRLLLDNIELFGIVHESEFNGQPILFSHAGLREAWIKANDWLFGDIEFYPSVLNSLLHHPDARPVLLTSLSQISLYRGGYDPAGSPVWADTYEFSDFGDFFPGYLHVFGHTYSNNGPLLIKTDNGSGWCVDCAKGFRLEIDGAGTVFPKPLVNI